MRELPCDAYLVLLVTSKCSHMRFISEGSDHQGGADSKTNSVCPSPCKVCVRSSASRAIEISVTGVAADEVWSGKKRSIDILNSPSFCIETKVAHWSVPLEENARSQSQLALQVSTIMGVWHRQHFTPRGELECARLRRHVWPLSYETGRFKIVCLSHSPLSINYAC